MSICELTKFEVSEPDNDGDMMMEIVLSGSNSSGQDVRLIKSSAVFFSKDGVCFASSSNTDTVGLEPDEEFAVGVGHAWMRERFAGSERNDIKCLAKAVLYRREYFRLGEVDVPKNEKSTAILDKLIEAIELEPNVKIALARKAPDEDGDVNIEVRCGIFNKSETKLDQVTLKVEILDEDDAVVGSDETSIEIESKAWGAIESSIWGLNKGLLRSAKARFALTIYHPVLTLSCEGLSTPAE